MNIEVNFNSDQSEISLKFPLKEFKRPIDFEDGITILEIFCGDFGVDPELTGQDLKSMHDDATNEGKGHVEFKVTEDGVEY